MSLASEQVLSAIAGQNRFLVQQVFKPIANEYRISVPAPGSSEEGEQLLYVKQKRMKIKEDIRFRVPGVEDEHVFMIKSKTVFEFAGKHEVLDAEGAKIGQLGKDFKKSLLRSHWVIQDAQDNVLFQARESSMFLALLRRFAAPAARLLLAALLRPVQLHAVHRRAPTRRPAPTSASSASCATATCSSSATGSPTPTGGWCWR